MLYSKKHLRLLALLVAVLFAFSIVSGGFEGIVKNAYTQFASALKSPADYGRQLGETVHHSVLNIRANVPNSQITHADTLSIMCVENAALNANTCASAGDCGLTQVIKSTFNLYVYNNKGGCGYIKNDFKGRVAHDNLSNPRLSIEVGSCIFNDALKRCGGDRSCAYHIYNSGRKGGSPYVNRFDVCYENIRKGNQFSKIATSIWSEMIRTVAKLTGGTFKTQNASRVPISASGWGDSTPPSYVESSESSAGWKNTLLGKLFFGQSGLQTRDSVTKNYGTYNPQNEYTYVNNDKNFAKDNPVNKILSVPSDNSLNKTTLTPPWEERRANSSNPKLLCVQNTVEKNEPAFIFWQCKDGSQTASAINFDTKQKAYGKIVVSPQESAKYTLLCESGTTKECYIDVISPSLAITSDKENVKMWDRVELSWMANDVENCSVESDDDASKHKDWERFGIKGIARSHPITKKTEFTLNCVTKTGLTKKKTVEVGINND